MNGILVPALTLALAQSIAPTLAGDDASEFLRLEQVWNEAHLKGDANVLDRLWLEDIVVIVPKMAPFDRAAALGVMRSGRMKFERYSTSEIKVRMYQDAAVVTGRLQRSRIRDGRSVDDDWRFTKVYLRRENAWKVASFHASDTGE